MKTCVVDENESIHTNESSPLYPDYLHMLFLGGDVLPTIFFD
jgi:hypothetical protein